MVAEVHQYVRAATQVWMRLKAVRLIGSCTIQMNGLPKGFRAPTARTDHAPDAMIAASVVSRRRKRCPPNLGRRDAVPRSLSDRSGESTLPSHAGTVENVSLRRAARQRQRAMDWLHGEPALNELISEPIIRLLMAKDG